LIGATLGALLGSRILGLLEAGPALFSTQQSWQNWLLALFASKTIVGGLLGGLIGVELLKKGIGEKSSSGDLFTYPLILAMLIGRLGCFSMGVYEPTYGVPTTFLLGMDLGDGLRRHPVAMYEVLYLGLFWLLLRWLEKEYPLAPGARFKIFMLDYLCFRCLLDFIKPVELWPWGLSAIQSAAVLGWLYYWRYLLNPGRLFVKVEEVEGVEGG
jgi:prolipoprotein diacylglyceryltransferase